MVSIDAATVLMEASEGGTGTVIRGVASNPPLATDA